VFTRIHINVRAKLRFTGPSDLNEEIIRLRRLAATEAADPLFGYGVSTNLPNLHARVFAEEIRVKRDGNEVSTCVAGTRFSGFAQKVGF
jgi:hypothetical protein